MDEWTQDGGGREEGKGEYRKYRHEEGRTEWEQGGRVRGKKKGADLKRDSERKEDAD